MKINTKVELTQINGQPFDNKEEQLTVGTLIGNLLANQLGSTNPVLGLRLAQKFAIDDEVEITVEDVVFIKDAIMKADKWPTLIKGQLIEQLEK